MKETRVLHKYYNWIDDQISIMCDILCDSDIEFVEKLCRESDESYFMKIDKRSGFVEEVNNIQRSNSEITLIRAFWIVNLVYIRHYKKARFVNLHSYYEQRRKVVRSSAVSKRDQ